MKASEVSEAGWYWIHIPRHADIGGLYDWEVVQVGWWDGAWKYDDLGRTYALLPTDAEFVGPLAPPA